MDSKTKKLALIGAAVVAVGAGVTLALQAFNENLVFFFSPTQVAAQEAPTGRTFRLGGVVEPGSVKRQADGVTVTFGITDTAKIVPVQYKGILPDLFAEGQGVVAQGQFDVVGPGRTDAAQVTHALQGLIDPQHPGDAALGRHFIDDIRQGDTQLGLGLFQVIQHHRHWAVLLIFRLHGQAGQRIDPRWARGLRVGFRFRDGIFHWRGFRIRRRGRFVLFTACGQA